MIGNMNRDERLKLKELSIKAFGKPSAWHKLYQRGYATNLVEKLPDGTERKYKGTKHLSMEELYKLMDEMIAKKAQEEAEKLKSKDVTNETFEVK